MVIYHPTRDRFLKRTLGKPSSSAKSVKIEVPKGWGVPQKFFWFRFWILNRRILVQTECFLYSSPKAGLNAVLGIEEGQNAKH